MAKDTHKLALLQNKIRQLEEINLELRLKIRTLYREEGFIHILQALGDNNEYLDKENKRLQKQNQEQQQEIEGLKGKVEYLRKEISPEIDNQNQYNPKYGIISVDVKSNRILFMTTEKDYYIVKNERFCRKKNGFPAMANIVDNMYAIVYKIYYRNETEFIDKF